MASRPFDGDLINDEPILKAQLKRTWRMLLMVVSASMAVVGLVFVVLRNHFGASSDVHNVVLEVGVNLALFGCTTLLVTVIASQQLEHQILGELNTRLNAHVKNVGDTMNEVQSEFRKTIETFLPLFGNGRDLGLDNIFLTRTDALIDIESHLRDELKSAAVESSRTGGPDDRDGPRARLWFVGTSLKGILEASALGFDGAGILSWAASLAAQDLLDLRVLLTHPTFARVRARQEHRAVTAIPEEISEALEFLHAHQVNAACIRMTQASPTVFAIATRERMLLNPYPYGAEAHRSFAIIVKRVHQEPNDHDSLHRDIFEQYEQRHFVRPWDDGLPVEQGAKEEPFVIPEATFNPLRPDGGDPAA